MTRIHCLVLLFVLHCAQPPAAALAQEGEQQYADLGDFRLKSGELLRDLRVGYRTLGRANADSSNVILFPTWFAGTSEDLRPYVGPGKLADTSRYFIILIDAIGNGISSSPSNSQKQPRMQFPKITIDDMVRSQHEVVTKILGLRRLKAVMGISMGGMQTFQWMVSYPDFLEKAIPIVGSPRLAAYDLLYWETRNQAIRSDPAWNGGEYTESPARAALFALGRLMGTTPHNYNRTITREDVLNSMTVAKTRPGFDANNHIRQSEAMMTLDVSSGFGGSMEQAAAAVKAKVFVIVSATDHVVTPEPAIRFARLLGAKLLTLRNDCGHDGPDCEEQRVLTAMREFLSR